MVIFHSYEDLRVKILRLRGFSAEFRQADHNCAVTDEDILDMFDFATAEFNQVPKCPKKNIKNTWKLWAKSRL